MKMSTTFQKIRQINQMYGNQCDINGKVEKLARPYLRKIEMLCNFFKLSLDEPVTRRELE